MKINKTTKTILFSIPILVGAYFIYRQLRQSKNGVTSSKTTNSTSITAPPPPTGAFSNFKVVTSGSNLNVRQSPNTSSSITDRLPNGSVVKARPSSTVGWSEYSKDGKTLSGYVSSSYLVSA